METVLNQVAQSFINELKDRIDVEGIILFGSWARGNQRPNSDVDLVVILSEGYRRAAEKREGQVFEIIYTTEKGVLDYWVGHRDDAADLWTVAKILYDPNGAVQRLRVQSQKLLDEGKRPIEKSQLGQFRFDAEDQVDYASFAFEKGDATTANMILMNKIFGLTELYFDIHQEWTPAPKQRLAEIKKRSGELYGLLKRFYGEDVSFNQKVAVAKQIISQVFCD